MTSLDVLIEGRLAGRVDLDGRGGVSLRYEAAYARSDRATPLSTRFLADDALVHSGEAVENWLMGLLPDDERVMGYWHAEHGVEMSRPLDLLGTEIGAECAGAVQFCKPENTAGLLERRGGLHPMSDDEVVEHLLKLRADPAYRPEGYDPAGGASLTGKQPKIGLRRTADGWALPWGAEPTSHILKVSRDGERFEHESLMQHIVMGAARRLAMTVPPTRMLCVDDLEAVVVRRYDRYLDGGGYLCRLHQEDLCQASGRHPRAKYQRLGGAGPGELAALLRTVAGREDGEAMVRGLRDMMGLQWLVVNNDLHTKNLSLVLSGGRRALAPVYDASSALPYRQHYDIADLRVELTVGRGYSVAGIDTPVEIAETARVLGLDAAETAARFEEMANLLPDALRETVEDLPGALQSLPMVADYYTDQAHRARRCEQIAATAHVEATTAARPAEPVHDVVTYLRSLGVATEPADAPAATLPPGDDPVSSQQTAQPCGAEIAGGVCRNQVPPDTERCRAGHTPVR